MWLKLSFLALIFSTNKHSFGIASSVAEIETLGYEFEADALTVPVSQAEDDRNLQSCTPAHANVEGDHSDGLISGNLMFYDGEIWTAPGIAAPMVLRWDLTNCEMVIGRHAPAEVNYMVATANDVFQFDNLETAYAYFQSTNVGKQMFKLDINGTELINSTFISYNGVTQDNWPNYDSSMGSSNSSVAAYSQDAYQFIWTREEVFEFLLTGLSAYVKMANTNDVSATHFARLVNRDQIRIIDMDGFYYINRKYVHSTSGLSYSSNFFQLHNKTDGGLNSDFSICENIDSSNEPIYSASAEVGFCCGRQCTHDMSKVYKSSLCNVVVNNCYNPLLESCTVETLPCENVIAEPEDQKHALFPSDRSPLSSENTWSYFGRYDFTGGYRFDEHVHRLEKGVRLDGPNWGTQYQTAEARFAIPFDNPGDGNGRYQIKFWGGRHHNYSPGTPAFNRFVTFKVISYSTGEELVHANVGASELPFDEYTSYTVEVTIADRHLGDIGLKVIPQHDAYYFFDFAEIKYLYHQTLSPTPYPTPQPTPHPTPQPTPQPTPACTNAILTLRTDNYPHEISWRWIANGIVTNNVNGGYYGSQMALYSHHLSVCGGNCYQFDIYDAANDGICCGYGHGYYQIHINGALYIHGGQYGNWHGGNFCY